MTERLMESLSILLGYPYFPSQTYKDVQEDALAYVQRLRDNGHDVEGFCLTLNPPSHCLPFPELDRRWRRGDKELLGMYERLEARLRGKDVLINQVGINLHPEFVQQLPVFTVFQCFDDPESSGVLSRPVAASYDLCLVGNIAEVNTYRSWGVKHAEWTPMGLTPEIYDTTLTYEEILNGERDIDLFLMCDRSSPWRADRLEKLAQAFPDAHFYGRGWPRGFLPHQQQLSLLRRARIGPNFHNSTGPINFRTFYLPANGVLQVCDNRHHLDHIFELGVEAIGFETVEECVDHCRYYLAHENERRTIAANGWRRTMRDYTENAVFNRTVTLINQHRTTHTHRDDTESISLRQHRQTRLVRSLLALPIWIQRHVVTALKSRMRRYLGYLQSLGKRRPGSLSNR